SLDTPWTTIRSAALADAKTVVVGWKYSRWSTTVKTWLSVSPPPHRPPVCSLSSSPCAAVCCQDAKTVVVGWKYSRWSTTVKTWLSVSPPPHRPPVCSLSSSPCAAVCCQDAKTVVVGWKYSRWSTTVKTWLSVSPPPHRPPVCSLSSSPCAAVCCQDAKTVVVGWKYSRWSTTVKTWLSVSPPPHRPPVCSLSSSPCAAVCCQDAKTVVSLEHHVKTWLPPKIHDGDKIVFKWNDWRHKHNVVAVDTYRYLSCYFGNAGPPFTVVAKASKQGTFTIVASTKNSVYRGFFVSSVGNDCQKGIKVVLPIEQNAG
ncbi:unnamed protein product, partial [Closterium sp. Yama58-4]